MATRRSKGDGHIGKRPDGRWIGQINVSPPGAKRKRRTVYGLTKAEVRRKMGEAVEQHKQGNYTTSSMTFEAWLTHWLDRVVDVRPGSKANYARIVRLYLIPTLGKVKLDQLNTDHVRRLHDAMDGMARSTVRNAHTLAGGSLTAAMDEGLTIRNPFKIAKRPGKSTNDRRPLMPAELAMLYQSIEGASDEARWRISLTLGPRQGEALGLTWDRVDLDALTIDIDRQSQRIGFKHGCPKATPCKYQRAASCPQRIIDAGEDFDYEIIEANICWTPVKTESSNRRVPIPRTLVGPLRRRWVEYCEQRLDPGFTDHGLVFAQANGRPWDDRKDYWNWRDRLTGAGIERLALHAARNTAATTMLRDGVDVVVVRAILGHTTAEMTQSYQRADLTMARLALDS